MGECRDDCHENCVQGCHLVSTEDKLNSAIGIYLAINGESLQSLRSISNLNAKDKAEVRVDFYGDVRDFTYEEFFSRLGYTTPEDKK